MPLLKEYRTLVSLKLYWLSGVCRVLQERLRSIELVDVRSLVAFAVLAVNQQSPVDLSSVPLLHR